MQVKSRLNHLHCLWAAWEQVRQGLQMTRSGSFSGHKMLLGSHSARSDASWERPWMTWELRRRTRARLVRKGKGKDSHRRHLTSRVFARMRRRGGGQHNPKDLPNTSISARAPKSHRVI